MAGRQVIPIENTYPMSYLPGFDYLQVEALLYVTALRKGLMRSGSVL